MSLSRIFYLRLALAVEQFGVTCEMLDDRIDKVMDAIKKLNRSNMAPHGPRAANAHETTRIARPIQQISRVLRVPLLEQGSQTAA